MRIPVALLALALATASGMPVAAAAGRATLLAAPAGRATLLAAAAARIDPDQLERIGRGEIVFEVEDAGKGDRKIRFAGVVNGPPEAVYQVLTNLDIYAQVLPAYFIESTVKSREETEAVAMFRFRTYWPFPDRYVVSRYQMDSEHRSLAWWRIGGSVLKNDGTVVVRPFGQDRSLVDFRVSVDPGIPFIPHWIFGWVERQVVPGVLTELDRYLTRTRASRS